MKGVQCYELFGGIALKIHTFSFFFHYDRNVVNKYRLYLLLGVIIINVIDYISICMDTELSISLYNIYIYILYINILCIYAIIVLHPMTLSYIYETQDP